MGNKLIRWGILAAFLFMLSCDTGPKVSIVGGCLKQWEGFWYVLDDENHTPLPKKGIYVEQTNHYITLHLPRSGDIVSFVCGTDEMLAKIPLGVGASVTDGRANIHLTHLGNPVDPATTLPENSNIWFIAVYRMGE